MSEAIEPVAWSDASDNDSNYDDELLSTASVSSRMYNFEEENGRSYHAYKSGKYVIPNDQAEQDRMDIHYHSLRLTLENKHWIAPMNESPTSVLDVGTGSGIWAMDVADDYPSASVLGIDLSRVQPGFVPPNLEFVVGDADEPWEMPNRFDLVHTRFMNGYCVRSWPQFYEQAFMSMKHGGWVENQEIDSKYATDDGTIPVDSALVRWVTLWNEAMETVGLTGRCYPYKMKQQMIDAGFINVTVREYKMPMGPWPKDKRLREAGLLNLIGTADGLTGLSLRTFTKILGWSVEELDVLLKQVRTELKRKSMHSYLPTYVVYGQKPPIA